MRSLLSGLIIQASSSASNFLLVLGISIATTAEEFGAFALIYALLGFGLGVVRSALLDLILIDGGKEDLDARSLHGGARRVLKLGGTAGLVGLAVASLIDPPSRSYLALLSIGLVVVLINDFGRFAAMAVKQRTSAVRSDLIWLVVAVIAFFAPISPQAKIAIWILGAAMGAAANDCLRSVLAETLTRNPTVEARDSKPNLTYVADFALLASRGLLLLFALRFAFGPTAVAVIAMSQQLFQPLISVLSGARFSYLGAMSKTAETTKAAPLGWIGAAVTAGVVWIALIAQVPAETGSDLLGESFGVMKPYIWAVCLFQLYRLVEAIFLDWFKASDRPTVLIRLRILSAIPLYALAIAVATGIVGDLDWAFYLRLMVGAIVALVMLAVAVTSKGGTNNSPKVELAV